MGKRKKNHDCLPTIADMAANDDNEIVEQTNMSRKKAKKTPGESHACGQTREKVWFESDFFLFSLFQSNLSLVGTEASPFGGTPSLHMPTYLTDVDPPVNEAYLLRCLPTV